MRVRLPVLPSPRELLQQYKRWRIGYRFAVHSRYPRPANSPSALSVKIPKERTVLEKAEDGRTYVKSVPLRFPVLTYLLSVPVRAYRRLVFGLRVRGILPIPSSADEQDSDNATARNDDVPVGATPIEYGPVSESPIKYTAQVDGQSVSGTVTIRFEHVHPDPVDGTDIIRFSWHPDERAPFVTLHSADFFLRALIDKRTTVSAQQLHSASTDAIGLFGNNLCLRDAKALVDDRTYEHILISGDEIEIRLKYTGLLASLAKIPADAGKILVLLSGVIGADDILDPFLVTVPFSLLAEGSTVAYDDGEQEWQAI